MNAYKPRTSVTDLIAEGRQTLFVAGLVSGAAALLWLAFGPALFGAGAWWPFNPDELVSDLDVEPVRLRLDVTAWWVTGLGLATLGFAGTWLATRRQRVTTALAALRQHRRVEHADAIATADAIWNAAEDAHFAGDDARQAQLLDQYADAAALVTLTRDVRTDRVAHLDALAAELQDSEPRRAAHLLDIAARLARTGGGHAPGLPRVLAWDAGAFLAGTAATLVGVPLVSLAVMLVIGFVVFLVKAVLAILAAIFAILQAIVGIVLLVGLIALVSD